MVQYTLPSLLAIATGVIGSGWMAGAIASFSLFGVPVALTQPQQQVDLWYGLYTRGAAVMPKVAIPITLAYAYASYETANLGGDWQGFAVAGALVIGIVPLTLTVMDSTIKSLKKGLQGAPMSHEEAAGLINYWSYLNVFRAMMPLAGAVAGSITFLNNAL